MVIGKAEFANELAKKLPNEIASKAAAARIVNAFLDEIGEKLAAGETIRLIGFGTFETVTRPERTGRNPLTGKSMTIPEKRVPRFSAGAGLKQKVAK